MNSISSFPQKLLFRPKIRLILGFCIFEIFFSSFESKCEEASPIDVVFTWVNGSDPWFLDQLTKYTDYANQTFESGASNNRFEGEKGQVILIIQVTQKILDFFKILTSYGMRFGVSKCSGKVFVT